MTCAHHQIQTWRAADTGEPLMWSCVDCARKFVPLTRQMIDDEALLRQALSAIHKVLSGGDFDHPYAELKQAAAAIEERLG